MKKPAILAALSLASLLSAQSNPDAGILVGNVGPTGPQVSLAGELYVQDVNNNCAAAVRRGTGLAMAVNGGGTAYDAARQAVWVSDGARIALQQVANAQVSCQFNATLSGSAGANFFISGLAHCDKRRQLIAMEMVVGSSSNSMVLRFYDTTSCPPTLLTTTCTFQIPNGNTPGVAHGLAYDEVRDLIFFSQSLTGIVGTTTSVQYVNFPVACLVRPQSFPVPLFTQCNGQNIAVTGMAYDSCGQILYLTEGLSVMKLDISNLQNPVNLNQTTPCCPLNVARKGWAGLAVVPNSVVQGVGQSCLNQGCPGCSSMSLGFVGGDLALGNQDLKLQVSGAPAGGSAGFYISAGKCVTPGLSLPGLCGSIHVAVGGPQPLFIGTFPLSSGTGCAGSLTIPTPLPATMSICGLPLCTQFLIRCPSGGQAAGLTNAVEFQVGG